EEPLLPVHPWTQRLRRQRVTQQLAQSPWGLYPSEDSERRRSRMRLWRRLMRNMRQSSQIFPTEFQSRTELPLERPLPRQFLRSGLSKMPIMQRPPSPMCRVGMLGNGNRPPIPFLSPRLLRPTTCQHCFLVGAMSLHSSCVEAPSLSLLDHLVCPDR